MLELQNISYRVSTPEGDVYIRLALLHIKLESVSCKISYTKFLNLINYLYLERIYKYKILYI